jgi:uncharacterized protein (TIGR02145 family)
MSARVQNRESIDNNFGQLIQASASAEVAKSESYSHFDPATNTAYAFTAVRRDDLASYYASQIESGLSEAERILELAEQFVGLGRRIEALDKVAESKKRVESLDFYRDLLAVVDPEKGVERSQGTRTNELLAKIAAAQTAHGRPGVVIFIASDTLTDAQKRVLMSKIIVPFTASNLYRAIDKSDIFLQRPAKENIARTGSINKTEVYKAGREAGASYVCYVDLVNAFGTSYNVFASLINVATGNVFGSPGQTDIKNLEDIDYAAAEIFKQIHLNTGSLNDGTVMTDPRDGKIYRTVEIGNQIWMAENLNYAAPNSLCYEKDEANCRKNGRLYDWNTARGTCPGGWRLPTARDWEDLVRKAGGWKAAGSKLKSNTDWNGSNDFGFAALPSGARICGGTGFGLLGENAYWWSSTERGRDNAVGMAMDSNYDFVGDGDRPKSCGFSIRCVQDKPSSK